MGHILWGVITGIILCFIFVFFVKRDVSVKAIESNSGMPCAVLLVTGLMLYYSFAATLAPFGAIGGRIWIQMCAERKTFEKVEISFDEERMTNLYDYRLESPFVTQSGKKGWLQYSGYDCQTSYH